MVRSRRLPAPSGFTLVELVVVIVLVGVLGVVAANIIGRFVGGYTQSADRVELAGVGRVAMERMAREIRQAVPNSIRVLDGGRQLVFLRAAQGGRYVAVGASASRLMPGVPGDAFVAYGLSGLATDDQLAVYPLAAGPLYSSLAGTTSGPRARIDSPGSPAAPNASRRITLDGEDALSAHSPQRRILAMDALVGLCYRGGADELHLAVQESVSAGPDPATVCDSGTSLLAAPVTSASFTYEEGALSRSGRVRIYLRLSKDPGSGAYIDFQQEVHVRNAP